MPRRVSPSQLKNMIRQAEQKQKRAIDAANRAIKDYNRKVKQDIDRYNREVRTHNARVRADRQRLKNEVARLNRQGNTTRYSTFRVSVKAVQTAYEQLETAADLGRYDSRYNEVLDLSEREAANNALLMNALLDNVASAEGVTAPNDPESPLTSTLHEISRDLSDRWRGALFSLSPNNPDAARHFCTSAREILTKILDLYAPDNEVASAMPDCDRTQQGTPTRRSKIKYILRQRDMEQEELASFVDNDMENVLQLFHTFNQGTHGEAGRFEFHQLQAIRIRVEDGLSYLTNLVQ